MRKYKLRLLPTCGTHRVGWSFRVRDRLGFESRSYDSTVTTVQLVKRYGFTMKLIKLNLQGPLLTEAFFKTLGRAKVMCSRGHYKTCKRYFNNECLRVVCLFLFFHVLSPVSSTYWAFWGSKRKLSWDAIIELNLCYSQSTFFIDVREREKHRFVFPLSIFFGL